MNGEGNQFNFDPQESFAPQQAESINEVEGTREDASDYRSVESTLRAIWNQQLAKREEKFAQTAFTGELAQKLLARAAAPAHLHR